jgi:RecJ-like exonuclease
VAKELLLAVGSCEWHHTSRFANETKFYNLAEAIEEMIEAQFDFAKTGNTYPIARQIMAGEPVDFGPLLD